MLHHILHILLFGKHMPSSSFPFLPCSLIVFLFLLFKGGQVKSLFQLLFLVWDPLPTRWRSSSNMANMPSSTAASAIAFGEANAEEETARATAL